MTSKIENALLVLAHTNTTRAWLAGNDPQALAQADEALGLTNVPTPSSTLCLEDYMAVWEAMLEWRESEASDEADEAFNELWDGNGAAAMRTLAIDVTRAAVAAWDALTDDQRDEECFDWEFAPRFIRDYFAPRWEVQTETFVDGWVNCWTENAGEADERLITFATREEAQAALREALEDDKEDGRESEEMRVARVAFQA